MSEPRGLAAGGWRRLAPHRRVRGGWYRSGRGDGIEWSRGRPGSRQAWAAGRLGPRTWPGREKFWYNHVFGQGVWHSFMGMLLDLSRFRGGEHQVRRTDPPSAFALEGEDFRVVSPVVFEVDVRKDAEKVRLVGRVATTLEMSCSRCLEAFEIPVDSTFDLLFLPEAAETASGEREMDEDDVGVAYYRDESIDLGEVMREQFFLALPMKPLCRETCLGLCPTCGLNWNQGSCTCQPAWVDPRMAPLAKLTNRS